MNEGSYLDPDTMKNQCFNAIIKLKNHNDKLDSLKLYFTMFINDDELKGESFTSLKNQIADYKTIIKNMKSANEYDISDFKTLMRLVGHEVIVGEEIIDMKKASYNNYTLYQSKADEYSQYARDSFLLIELTYYSWKAMECYHLASNELDIYRKCCDLENKYNEIESSTSGLFSNSTRLRSAVNAGLSDLSRSFYDGSYHQNLSAPWRESLLDSTIDLIMTVNEDGTIEPKWDNIRDILKRSASDISEEEYKCLSFLYLNLKDKDMGKFLGSCMKGEDVDVPWLTEVIGKANGFCNEDYSKWTVDNDKVNNIMKYVSNSSDMTLLLLQNVDSKKDAKVYLSLQEQRNRIIQRYTLLNVVKDIGEYHGEYEGEAPIINVEIGKDNSLILKFQEFRNIGSDSAPTFSNLGNSSVVISDTCNGPKNTFEALNLSETEFYGHFGNVDELQKTAKFVGGEARGQLITQGSEKLSSYIVGKTQNKLLGKAVGYIPFVGDVVSFGTDLVMDEQKADQDNKFIKSQFERLNRADIYRDFDCTTSFVTYDISKRTGDGSKKVSVYAYEGENTFKKVNSLNDNLDMNFTVDGVINNPNDAFDKKEKFFNENPENDDLYNFYLENFDQLKSN